MNLFKQVEPSRNTIYISTGQEMRNFIDKKNYTSTLIKKTLDSGALMPEFVPVYLWGNVFANVYDGSQNVILDGMPRKLIEAQILDSLFPFYELNKPWVIYLDIDHHESMKRLIKRGRSDDREHEIKKRNEWFESDVRPVVEYYRNNPNYNFLDIEGEASIEDVHAEIVKKIGLIK